MTHHASDYIDTVKSAFPHVINQHTIRFWAGLAAERATHGGNVADLLADIKTRRAAAAKADKALRAALVARYGASHYRITAADEVHVYGTMPNSAAVGWWLLGDRSYSAMMLAD